MLHLSRLLVGGSVRNKVLSREQKARPVATGAVVVPRRARGGSHVSPLRTNDALVKTKN